MVYPRKTVINFARKLDVLCHAWVGDYFAPTEPFLMCDSVALGGDGGIEVDLVVSELKGAYTLVVCISDILFCQLILWQRA